MPLNEPKPYRTKKNHMGEDLLPANSTYTEEQLAEMNRQHDQKMGWNQGLARVYTNPMRLPETHTGPISELWSNRK